MPVGKKIIGDKPYLVNRLLFLNGLTRSGKFLLGKLVSCIGGVEYYQYVSLLEHLPFLEKLGLISEEAAIALMRIHVDEHSYNYMVGRNLNARFSDASSIYNAPHFERYLSRSLSEDIPALLASFKNEKTLPCFIIHEMLPNIRIYFKAFPEVCFIDLHRHPVDLAHSWFRRGWGTRYLDDPLSFAPIIRGHRSSVPWFAASWKEEYEYSAPVDRIIRSIAHLTEEGEKTYKTLTANEQRTILRITYEQLVENPQASVEKMGSFMGSTVFPELKAVMGREKIPLVISLESRKKKLNELEAGASKDKLMLLNRLAEDYERNLSC